MAVHAWVAEGNGEPACLLVILNKELAGLELIWIHHIQQLPPCGIIFLQILSVEFLRYMLVLSMPTFAARISDTQSINHDKDVTIALESSCNE